MTSWVLTIARGYGNHWDVAKEHMLWDMTTRPTQRPIEQGDVVYFWLSRHGFIGRAEVAHGVVELPEDAPVPWTDGGERRYRSRIRFARTADLQRTPVTWGQVMAETGLPANPSLGHRTNNSRVERWLASLFEPWDEADAHFRDEVPRRAAEVIFHKERDTRERVLAEIDIRRGQPKFRQDLVVAYNSRCAITGSRTLQVLEAAHIFPYRGEHTNIVSNGLLLRADVHTLFDLYLLTVTVDEETYTIRVSADVDDEAYRSLDRQPLAVVPARDDWLPSRTLLAEHNAECRWLEPRPSIDLHEAP